MKFWLKMADLPLFADLPGFAIFSTTAMQPAQIEYSNTPLYFVYIAVNRTRAWVTYTFYHENIALY